jgi:membrane-bound metal-dependent hydrolase YbcI (DUF457 family)
VPSYREHIGIGFCVFVVSYVLLCRQLMYSSLQWAELGLCILLGSLFPDIDTKSKGQQLVYALSIILIVTLVLQKKVFAASLIALCCLLPLVTKHRGLFHDPWFLTLSINSMSVVALLRFPHQTSRIMADTLFFFLGVISHLVLDRFVRIPASFQHKKRWR